jgi:hypothetical protein
MLDDHQRTVVAQAQLGANQLENAPVHMKPNRIGGAPLVGRSADARTDPASAAVSFPRVKFTGLR